MKNITPDEMKNHIARFSELRPTKKDYEHSSVGIPAAAYERTAAENIYFVMAPVGVARGGRALPAVVGQPGLEVSIVECPPGQGPALHRHDFTYESFMPLDGKYEIRWGADGQHSVILNPFDFIAVPAGVYRAFRNVDDKNAKMLVLIQGNEQINNDLIFQNSVAAWLKDNFGESVVRNYEKIGIRFADS